MSEGMTDEAFHAEIDELDKQGRYALAMVRATREADRARASETEKAAEIERLKAELATAQHEVAQMDAALRVTVPEIEARISSTCVWCGTAAPDPTSAEAMRAYVAEHVKVCANHPMRALESELARLTPSGRVAEDVKELRVTILTGYPDLPGVVETKMGVLARLAAQAQGYEAMKAERDAAIARAEEAEKQARLAWERHAEKDKAYGGMIAQRDAAVADNAAKDAALDDAQSYMSVVCASLHESESEREREVLANINAALYSHNPGAALLKERQEREETIKALEGALTTIAERGVSSTDRRIARDALRLAGRLR